MRRGVNWILWLVIRGVKDITDRKTLVRNREIILFPLFLFSFFTVGRYNIPPRRNQRSKSSLLSLSLSNHTTRSYALDDVANQDRGDFDGGPPVAQNPAPKRSIFSAALTGDLLFFGDWQLNLSLKEQTLLQSRAL